MGHRYAPGPKPSSGRATTHGSGEARYRTEQAENAPRRVTANPRIVAAGFCDRAMSLPNYRNLSALIRSWLDALPRNMAADSGTAEDLRAICDPRPVRTREYRSAPGPWARLSCCTM
jgi:hypothetical protein